jgi:hypothetical protein
MANYCFMMAMTHTDGNEYSVRHDGPRLIWAPPGYIGDAQTSTTLAAAAIPPLMAYNTSSPRVLKPKAKQSAFDILLDDNNIRCCNCIFH